ncbi:MAG TPA: hypothetical protein VLT16_00505, partial [Candidatus Limnocylindrales bacterium]|nr:hypothetical protein [Candidatus Limnocylindrales bacterium]
YHRRRVRFLMAGLNSRGKEWRRLPALKDLTEAERRGRERRRVLAKYRRRSQRFMALGLNSRGQPRKYRVKEHAWKLLRAQMNLPVVELLGSLEREDL